MMVGNWPISKDELYGPPSACSITNNYEIPPPSIYVVPITGVKYQERSSTRTHYCFTGKIRPDQGLTC
ncbi:unnamed protein product [Rotaria sp. Silwood2]|nr:unnamed protein product [Rotaria sp. Silwood2]CAF4308258.1 unnamed protein product [Rotaria sp. Silwood2]